MAGHVALVAAGLAVAVAAAEAGKGGFHIKKRAGHIHEQVPFGGAFAGDNRLHHAQLLLHQFARLAKAKHGHGVGDLFQSDGLGL